MIELNNLSKVYQTPTGQLMALDQVNLKVSSGQIFGVIGKSGAGKSSLIRCVNGLDRPSQGDVIVNGQRLSSLSAAGLRELRCQIGMVFQHFNLLSRRTVFANIALPLELIGMDQAAQRQRIEPLLALTGLTDKRDVYPHQLSGGQKQRVAIARALATNPKVLLCDEMTSALDPETTRSILQLILDINQKLQLSILLITHEMGVIKQVADQVAVIDKGRIVEQADVFELFTQPKSETAKSFIQSQYHVQLPDALQPRYSQQAVAGAAPLWRISFYGEAGMQPVMSKMLQQIKVDLNIFHADLEMVHGKPLGTMMVMIGGTNEASQQAQQFLERQGVNVEVVGYVTAND